MHHAYILLGSNIKPEKNIKKALRLLRIVSHVEAVSSIWETIAVGSPGPNFLNAAVHCLTDLNIEPLKTGVLRPIENALGRIRTDDKNAPRTIDLDVVIYDGCVVDDHLWRRVHVAIPFSELVPDMVEPVSGRTLSDIAAELKAESYIKRAFSIV